MVVEGVNATRVAVALADRHGEPMPIAREVHAVLFDGKGVNEALRDLMSRGAGDE
jgi:glycerol-3-phosphate dehydrogenase (NAD(P)+)